MIAIALVCLNPGQTRPILVTMHKNLNFFSILARNTITELITFFVRETAFKSVPETRQVVSHQNYLFFIWKTRNPEWVYYAICQQKYPQTVAFLCLKEFEEVMLAFYANEGKKVNWNSHKDLNLKIESLKKVFDKFQNPENASNLLRAQQKLDQVKEVAQTNIDMLVDNEGLDKLVAESEDLKENTKLFMKNSAKLDKCCR